MNFNKALSVSIKLAVAIVICVVLNGKYYDMSMKMKAKDLIIESINDFDTGELSVQYQTHASCKEIESLFKNRTIQQIVYKEVHNSKSISNYVYDKADKASRYQAKVDLTEQVGHILSNMSDIVLEHAEKHQEYNINNTPNKESK